MKFGWTWKRQDLIDKSNPYKSLSFCKREPESERPGSPHHFILDFRGNHSRWWKTWLDLPSRLKAVHSTVRTRSSSGIGRRVLTSFSSSSCEVNMPGIPGLEESFIHLLQTLYLICLCPLGFPFVTENEDCSRKAPKTRHLALHIIHHNSSPLQDSPDIFLTRKIPARKGVGCGRCCALL